MSASIPHQRGQIFTVEDGIVVVEWYDFGEDVAHEFAVQVRFDRDGQAKMASAMGMTSTPEPEALRDALRDRFGTYWAVLRFADSNSVPYTEAREMQP